MHLSRKNHALIIFAAIAALTATGTAAAQPKPTTADACTLGTEWGRCLEVTARLDHAPSVGETATLQVELRSSAPVKDVALKVGLPAALAWEKAPAAGTFTVTAGQAKEFTATVRAAKAGSGAIRVQAVTGRGLPFDSDPVGIALTAGDDAEGSFIGFRKGPQGVAELPKDAVISQHARAYVPVGTEKLPMPFSDDPDPAPGIQATSCVTGRWFYNIGDDWFPSRNFEVQVWDEDPFSDDLLAVGVTDGNGGFRFCFENDDGLGGGGQDVYVKFVAFNQSWSIVDDDDDPYEYQFEVRPNIADGATLDYGRRIPANPEHHLALRAWETANDAAAWTPGRCWDRDDTDCRNIGIRWPLGSGARYDPNDDQVELPLLTPENPWIVAHEIGHGVMDDVYKDDMPDIDDTCREHFVTRAEKPACAWTEGFADWFGIVVLDRPNQPGFADFERHTWGTPNWDNGPNVEGRIAGALWDLHDPVGEAPWDRTQGPEPGAVWETFLDHRSESFEEFWRQRGPDGQSAGQLAALFQNTIDFGFRDVLTTGSEITVRSPSPPGQHNYRYDTRFRFWSVVAMRPPAAADYELELFDDHAMTQQLARSLTGTGTTDFIAVDSNAGGRELGDYYPRVVHRVGDGDYTIEVSDSGKLLPLSGDQRVMGPRDVVEVWDHCVSDRSRVTVTPSDASQDAELFVMSSAGGAVRVRTDNIARSIDAGPGQPESVEFTPAGLDCFGIVLINKAGSGTYTLTVS